MRTKSLTTNIALEEVKNLPRPPRGRLERRLTNARLSRRSISEGSLRWPAARQSPIGSRPANVLASGILGLFLILLVAAAGEAGELTSPFLKTLADYDAETAGRETASVLARTAFSEGLDARRRYDYPAAAAAFARSLEASATYSAAFNRAASLQQDSEMEWARDAYLQAIARRADDPELETNLGTVLGALWDPQAALTRFRRAVELLKSRADPMRKGRILIQVGLMQLDFGRHDPALAAFHAAELAFTEGGSAEGQAVAAAKQGVVLIQADRAKDGIALLLGAIGRLQALGSGAEEATARTDLARYYLDADLAQARFQLTRSIEVAEKLELPLELGRALNNLGVFFDKRGDPAAAERLFTRALAAFRQARDPVGQGEASNNLAKIALERGDEDKALNLSLDAVRHYQRAFRVRRLVQKLVGVAELFKRRGDRRTALATLEFARTVSEGLGEGAFEGTVLLTLAEYHLVDDLPLARRQAEAARHVFESQGLTARVKDADRLNAAVGEYRRQQLLGRGGLLAALLGLAAWAYRDRRGLRAAVWLARRARALWATATGPLRAAHAAYERRLDRWVGLYDEGGSDVITARGLEAKFARRPPVIVLLASVAGVLLVDGLAITLPHVRQIRRVRDIIARWFLPVEVRGRMEGWLDQLTGYVVMHLALEVVFFVVFGVVAALAIEVSVKLLYGTVRRITGGPVRPPAVEGLVNIVRNDIAVMTSVVRVGIVVMIALGFVRLLTGQMRWDPAIVGVSVVALVLVALAWAFWLEGRLIRLLAPIRK